MNEHILCRREFNDALKLDSNVLIDVFRDGRFVQRHQRHNIVTLIAQNMVRDAWHDGVVAIPDRFALGDDNTTPSVNDTELGNEVFRSVFSSRSRDVASINYKYFLTPGQANGFFLREAGLFNNTSNGLFAHVIFPEIEKTIAITVFFSWTINIGVP